uniref:Uncharacterized protein n=1 Tax=Arundo donax TaxID=35708 RepID=A0A0A9HA05_ARUDO
MYVVGINWKNCKDEKTSTTDWIVILYTIKPMCL